MSSLENLPVSESRTPHDFAAVREHYRTTIHECSLEGLAEFYGISTLEPCRDDDFCQLVEAILDAAEYPVRARFEFAYHLASSFWEDYHILLINQREFPGLFDEVTLPPWLIDRTMEWLLAGIAAYRDDREVMQMVHWLRYRRMNWDTYLTDAQLDALEQALGYPINAKEDPYLKEILQDTWEKLKRRQDADPEKDPEA